MSISGTLDISASGVLAAAFRYFAGTDTDWECYVGDGVHAGQVVSSGVVPDTTNMQQFDIFITSGGVYQYYINGTQVCSFTPTNPIPENSMLGNIDAWQNTTTTSVSVKQGRLYWGSN